MDNSRRNFIRKAAAAGAALMAAPALSAAGKYSFQEKIPDATAPFNLKYAPGMGMFREHAGNNPFDNIRFCNEIGFRAMFDNGLMDRPPEEQESIASEMQRLDMTLGPFVLYADFGTVSFVLDKPEIRTMLLERMQKGVEVARRTGAKWALMVPGRYDERLHRDYQTSNVIDNLRYCCDIAEPAGLTIVLEPLNTLRDHPGLFLTGVPQAYSICRAVNRSSCKIVNDLYHQQITEGNLIPNIDAAWSEIAAFHLGDNPGRNEPTTGEIHFRNIFRHLYEKNYDGVLCMEHGISQKGKEGEARVIAAYRECDDFI